ncbi:glycosyltransferase family 39 protein [Tabrizicola sp. J26]|uniref:glycosyltransferase family 39 protein n=1 Tax=Alitabrizicola rongguiensis TaxID=2909234 RepID=UPI001F42C9EF|nr:glycosyltransferase family 39 protein [Tabrizicola rongguiensis]MCF1709054.1 glycosyltransferase family 39 protein [Tabrizicola rongguiensis]
MIPSPPSSARVFDRPIFWILLFAVYAFVQGAIRHHYKTTLFGDDSELFLWARTLDWGYGVQPPLYAWGQWLVNRVFGESILSITVMRSVCLFGLYAAGYLMARRYASPRLAGFAALGLFLIPEIAQTFLRTRTHNLLVTAMVPLATLAFLDLCQRQRLGDYLRFGVLTALAILAKATGAIFLVALILAGLMRPESRQAVLTKRMGLALLLLIVLCAGTVIWSLSNAAIATASLSKFQPGGGWTTGLLSLGRATVDSGGFVAAAVGLTVLLTRRGESLPPETAILWRAGVLSVLLIALGVIFADAAEIKERWMVPVVAPLTPVALVWCFQRLGRFRFLPAVLGGLSAILQLALLPGYYERKEPVPRADYAALAAELRATGATQMWLPDDMAAGLAIASPGIPVGQRVDRGLLPCEGTVLLAVWPDFDPALEAFRQRLPGCVVTEAASGTASSGGPPVQYWVFTLTPAG